jgi:hypothetical protein
MAKRYRYVGQGQGVPGLPHEIDDEEARLLGVQELLAQALQAGVYKEISTKATAKVKAQEVNDG